jgi:hypothetical protein
MLPSIGAGGTAVVAGAVKVGQFTVPLLLAVQAGWAREVTWLPMKITPAAARAHVMMREFNMFFPTRWIYH